jgi:DNA-directed RNA polymerase subunit N (RpoN/RPB10)
MSEVYCYHCGEPTTNEYDGPVTRIYNGDDIIDIFDEKLSDVTIIKFCSRKCDNDYSREHTCYRCDDSYFQDNYTEINGKKYCG